MQVYRCFSNNLKEYLMKNGLRYILIAKDIVTDKQFWLFEKTKQFNLLLGQWEANSPKNRSVFILSIFYIVGGLVYWLI